MVTEQLQEPMKEKWVTSNKHWLKIAYAEGNSGPLKIHHQSFLQTLTLDLEHAVQRVNEGAPELEDQIHLQLRIHRALSEHVGAVILCLDEMGHRKVIYLV
jgi:hypothetical protein